MQRLEQVVEAGSERLSDPQIDLGTAGDETGVDELICQSAAPENVPIREVVERVRAPRDADRLEVPVLGQGEDADGTETLSGGAGRRVQVLVADNVGLLRIQEP